MKATLKRKHRKELHCSISTAIITYFFEPRENWTSTSTLMIYKIYPRYGKSAVQIVNDFNLTRRLHCSKYPQNTITLTASSMGLIPRVGVAVPRPSCSTGLFCFDRFFFFLGGSLSLDTRLSDSLATAFDSGDWAPLAGRLSAPSLSSSAVATGEGFSPLELAPKYFRFRGLPGPLFTGVDLPLPSSTL